MLSNTSECYACGEVFDTHESLRRHERGHPGRATYTVNWRRVTPRGTRLVTL